MSEQERVNAGVQPATGAGEPTPIIFLDDIRVTFKTRTGSILHPNKVQAVRGLTLKLMPGETLGIVGESGCGKSTTANVMCGLQQPTSGKVFFKGEDVTKRSAAQRRLIGRVISVVFQDPATALNARMSVHDQLMDPLVVHKVGDKTSRERRVLDLIEMVGLPNSVLDALPGQLSGGQRQRVAIGRAIVRDPQVFLMDEPLSNLDAKLRGQMRVEISKLHQRLETTIIYVTHDQTEAMTLGTRIVVMKDGVIQQVDSPQNLYDKPCNKFVAGFIGAPQMNMIDAAVGKDGSDVTLSFGGHTVALPEGKAKKLEEAGYVGKTVTLGIRPEDLHDEESFLSMSPKSVFDATIRVYEMLGSEVLLYFDIDDADFTAKVNPRTTARPGDTIQLALDLEKIHIFDKDTELVVLN